MAKRCIQGAKSIAPKPNKRPPAQPTSRQREVIELLARGKANKEIAAKLEISVRTAEAYRATIMLKFGFHSLADLVRYAIREGFISPNNLMDCTLQ